MITPTVHSYEVAGGNQYAASVRLVLDYGDGLATTINTMGVYPEDRRFTYHYWYPDTGWFGKAYFPVDGTVAIPTEMADKIFRLEPPEVATPTELTRLKVPGRRSIKPGQFVYVQPRQTKGTRRYGGVVETIYSDHQVRVTTGTTTVQVDAEWVHATNDHHSRKAVA